MTISSRQTELAWAAGLFDGEGSSSVARGGSQYRRADGGLTRYTSEHRYPKLSLSQNIGVSPCPLERFAEVLGEGNIVGPYKGRPRIRHWNVTGAGADRVMALLLPFLSGPKTAQWEKVLEEVNG